MYSVLYVDDERPLLELCRTFLEKDGDFSVDATHSVSGALEKLGTGTYDAIISDYQMPETDGIMFLKEVRSRIGDIPFILFTGKGREDVVIEAINNGADFYIQKGGPAGPQFAELAHKLRAAIERRRSARELQTNESLLQHFRASLDWASDEVYWLDFEGNFLYVNDAACRNNGYSREEFLAMKLSDLNPDFVPEQDEHTQESLKQNKTRVFMARHRHRDGTFVDVEIMANYVEKDGKAYSFAFVRDVTERKRAEAALRESEERYRRLIAGSFDSVVIHQNGSIIFANDAAARLVKAQSPAEMIGRPTLDFVDPRCMGLVGERIRTMSASPDKAVPLIEERFRCIDGTSVDVEVIATSTIHEGNPAIQVVARDITARKRTEEALRVANRQLSLLTGITRHDILNKVNAMSGYLELAKMTQMDPKMLEYIGRLETITQSIGDHIEFTRIYQDLGSTRPRWQNLAGVISRSPVPEGLHLQADVGDISIFADPIFEKIFSNLTDNTVRHGKTATRVRVSCCEEKGGLTIRWEDDGTGIPAGEKEKIFRQGYGKNTGLGLFLIREILSITGITILETGEYGRGARFEMKVPKEGYRVSPSGDGAGRR
jgi:PAS domain S-box-containing protein